MDFAYKTTGTDKVIIFDGAMGGLNCSESLAESLITKTPEVSKEVDEILMPKWFRERGVDVFTILKSLAQKMSKQTTRNMERTWYSAVGMRAITATVQAPFRGSERGWVSSCHSRVPAWYKVCYSRCSVLRAHSL